MRTRAIAALLGASLLAGCATYSPKPLAEASSALTAPDLSLLSADAQKIDRPYLTPQAIDLSQPLTPNALAVIAVLENPDLKALRARAGVTDAQAFAARLLPDPSFSANLDKPLAGGDTLMGFGGQLGVDLGMLRTARVTRESGDAAKRQVRLDLAWSEWQAAGQARLLGARILALETQCGLMRESAASAERLFAISQRAAGRGDISGTDLDTRRQAMVDATDKLRLAERDLIAARGELNKLLGLPPETDLRLAAVPDTATPPPAEALTALTLDRRFDLQALRAGYGVAEADLHKAVLDQFPSLSLTLSGARDTAGVVTAGPSVGFTLPLWNRNRGNIAVATATREQLRAEYDARLFQTRADIAAAVAGIETVLRQRAALLAQLPDMRRFADSTRRAATRGDVSLATAEAAGQSVRDRLFALSQLDQQVAEAMIALELLTGSLSEGWTR